MRLTEKIRDAVQLLERIQRDYAPAVFSTSFGAEDMVLTDLIARHAPEIGIFSLDTGRLPVETHRLARRVLVRYPVSIRVLHPDPRLVDTFVQRYGIDGFYESIEARKACCHARKVEPLARALAGRRGWVTGLRREQAATRRELGTQEWDADYRLDKFNPLAHWSLIDVWKYIRVHDVPYNELHDRRFPSIGCEPCTRAVAAGEDLRAGRWWWEDPATRECGLHRDAGAAARPGKAAGQ